MMYLLITFIQPNLYLVSILVLSVYENVNDNIIHIMNNNIGFPCNMRDSTVSVTLRKLIPHFHDLIELIKSSIIVGVSSNPFW